MRLKPRVPHPCLGQGACQLREDRRVGVRSFLLNPTDPELEENPLMLEPAELAPDAIESISARNSTASPPVLSGLLSNSDAATLQLGSPLRDPVLVRDPNTLRPVHQERFHETDPDGHGSLAEPHDSAPEQ